MRRRGGPARRRHLGQRRDRGRRLGRDPGDDPAAAEHPVGGRHRGAARADTDAGHRDPGRGAGLRRPGRGHRAAHRGATAPVRAAALLRRRWRRRRLSRRARRRRAGAGHRRPGAAARDHALGDRCACARRVAREARLRELARTAERRHAVRRRGLELRRRAAQRGGAEPGGHPAAHRDVVRQRRGGLPDADVVGGRGDPAAHGVRARGPPHASAPTPSPRARPVPTSRSPASSRPAR